MAVAAQSQMDEFRRRVVGRRITEDTFAVYKTWIERFEAWYDEDRDPVVGDLIDFDGVLVNEDGGEFPWEATTRNADASYSWSSRNIAMSAIKVWLQYQYDVHIEENSNNIVMGDPADFDPAYLSMDDVQEVIDYAPVDCDVDGCEAALRLSYDAILRASELVLIEQDDIDFDAGTVRIEATKGSMDAVLDVRDSTLDALGGLLSTYPDRNRVFYNSYGRPWRANSWAKHFERKHHDVGSHAFGRHSPIVHRLQYPGEFYDLEANPDVFGQTYRRARHRHPDMTARYARVVGADIPDWAAE